MNRNTCGFDRPLRAAGKREARSSCQGVRLATLSSNLMNIPATIIGFRPCQILILLLLAPSVRVLGSDINLSSNDLAHAVQVATSIGKLTANKINAVRDQAWLAFMLEFYKAIPNAPPANAIAATYAGYTNAFNSLSTVANFPSQYLNPSAPELYNLIVSSARQNLSADLASYAPYAASAVEVASELQAQANPALQMLSTSVQTFTSYGFQRTLARLNSSLLSPTNWHALVDGSLNLAAANAQFKQAYQSIITPITQMAPGDSLDQILQEVPELSSDYTVASLLSNIGPEGILQLSTNDILSFFGTQMTTLNQTVSNSLSGLVLMVAGQSDMLNYLQNPALVSQISALQAAFQSEATPVIQASTAAFDLLGTVLGQADQSFAPLASTITTVGQGATAIADAVNSFDVADLAGTLLGSVDGVGAVMDVAGLVGGLLGGGGLGGLFGGGSSDADQQILSQLAAIQNPIANLQADMDARFNQIDNDLNTMYNTMQTDFGSVLFDLRNLQTSLNSDAATLVSAIFDQQLLLLAFVSAVE
jgi:hypothetical protein